jgi:DNA repair exonuclease SbcCD ATPase subunit
MAELAAIGLAGNIVQFVDFGFKLSRDFKELYQSAEGGKAKHLELEDLMTDLESLCQKLQKTTGPATQDDEELRDLARACAKLARELLAMLEKVKVNKERNPKLASLKQALKNIWKDKDISALEERLGRYREQLNQRLVYILRYVLRTCMPQLRTYACSQ